MLENTMYHRKLFIVYNRAIHKAKGRPDTDKITQRLNKALGILQSIEYYKAEKAGYQPTATTCNCKDWQYHYAAKRGYKFHCKHMMAVTLMERINGLKYIQTDFFSVC